MSRIALVAGSTGLIGNLLLRRLLEDSGYAEVRVLSRRALDLQHARLKVIQTDYYNLGRLGDALAVDDVFCCLGTTLAKAGSRAAFEDVDYRMVVELARAARNAGARQFLVVSALGASEHSPSFYSRVKARMEDTVAALGYDAVHILRPSLLLGKRSESRPLEDLAQRLAPALAPVFRGRMTKFRPVAAADVAAAMQRLALRGDSGTFIHYLPLAD